MDSSEIYHAPNLLILICFMSSMAFVVSASQWLWRVNKNTANELSVGFDSSIWRGQIFSLLFVMVLSILIGLYDFYVYARPVNIYGEVLILGVFFAFSFFVKKSGGTRRVLCVAREVLFFGFVCLFAWGVTIGSGFIIAQILKTISVIERDNFYVFVIFLSGALWNIPILWGHRRALHNSDVRGALQGRGFHKFLWPVLLAYIVILIPLMMQDISNSDKWHDMHNIKPMRQI
ncbi:MAG: hypothetical protein COA45_08525 [Zetaproteobacteria bacterium]|nr:MAG: hypothetical protein COA45_08525 [Zetaproteobacteria bacterium]